MDNIKNTKVEYYYIKMLDGECRIYRQEIRTSIVIDYIKTVKTKEEAAHETELLNTGALM